MKRWLSQAEIREHLEYDPTDGVFIWSANASPRLRGRRAGTAMANGYRRVRIDGEYYTEHRLAWVYMTGDCPELQIDHVNGLRWDNRWENLRLATNAQNQRNRRTNFNNRIGLKGVCVGYRGRYRAVIFDGKRSIFLGHFDTPKQAHDAYSAKAAELFGEYARAS